MVDDSGEIVISNDYIQALPSGEHKVSVKIDGQIFETLIIVDEGVPLSAGNFQAIGYWSLFDLCMTIVTLLSAIIFLAVNSKNKEESEEDDEENNKENEKDIRKKRYLKGGAVAIAIVTTILLLVTQNFRLNIGIFDDYSIIFFILTLVEIFVGYKITKKEKRDDSDLEEYSTK